MIKKIIKRTGGAFGINEVRDDIGTLRDIENENANDFKQKYDQLVQGVANINTQFNDLKKSLAEIKARQAKIEEQLEKYFTESYSLVDYSQKLAALQYESLATLLAGPTEDSQKRFFSSISPARGDLRIFQLGCEKLMFELFKICEQHSLPIWIHSGTLLGAARNQGFIPWDDDVDTSMMRDDLETLRRILANHPKYRLAVCFDYNVYCKQLRFRTRDPKNLCFVDIFISDYTKETNKDKAHNDWLLKKQDFIRKIEATNSSAVQTWREKKIIAEDEEFGDKISILFDQFLPEPPVYEDPQNCHIDWGLDNLEVKEKRLVSYDTIFPTTILKFEGHSYSAPHKYHELLTGLYGDYYDLPRNVFSHFQHVDKKNYNVSVIEKFLSE